MYEERKKYEKSQEYKPKYIPIPIWQTLKYIPIQAKVHSYTSDKKFKNLSVANTTNHASNEGSSMHTGGSISMGEHARRMEVATQVKPSIEEMFAKCHLKKDNTWVDNRSENAMENFKKRK